MKGFHKDELRFFIKSEMIEEEWDPGGDRKR
jgi:hypothetical protein